MRKNQKQIRFARGEKKQEGEKRKKGKSTKTGEGNPETYQKWPIRVRVRMLGFGRKPLALAVWGPPRLGTGENQAFDQVGPT